MLLACGRWQSKARHNAMRKWYNSFVARATKRPHRSGTGQKRGGDIPVAADFATHPAIAQTALHNSKHDVQMKYWSYFITENDMIASCASHLGRHLVSMFSPLGLTRASFECMEKGSCVRKIGRVDYNLFGNNCHMFTASCVFGTLLEKLSAADWLKDGTFSIERLEETIRHRMNHGLQIAWLGVRGPTPQFNCELPAEKTARLRDEGLV